MRPHLRMNLVGFLCLLVLLPQNVTGTYHLILSLSVFFHLAFETSITVETFNQYPVGLLMPSFQNASLETSDGSVWTFYSNAEEWTDNYCFFGMISLFCPKMHNSLLIGLGIGGQYDIFSIMAISSNDTTSYYVSGIAPSPDWVCTTIPSYSQVLCSDTPFTVACKAPPTKLVLLQVKVCA